jgi:hypothetical protein
MGVYTGDALGLKETIFAGIRDVAELFLRPRQFVAHQNIDRRRRLHAVLRWLRRRELRGRKRALALLPRRLRPIPESIGFRWVDDLEPGVIRRAVAEGRKRLAGLDLDALRHRSRSPHLMWEPLIFKGADDPLLTLATHPGLVRMIGDYIGSLPVMRHCLLYYSPNTEVANASSQFYHLDGQDVRTLNIFLFLHDVEPAHGPMVAYSADASEQFARLMKYRKVGHTQRVADSFIEQHLLLAEPHAFNGPKGSLLACDVDRCFHYGSRGASQPRFLIAIQYVSAAGFNVPFRRKMRHVSPECGQLQTWQVKVLGG